MTDKSLRIEFDNNDMLFRGPQDSQIDLSRIEMTNEIYVEISKEFAEDLVAISLRYQGFLSDISQFNAAKGFKATEDGDVFFSGLPVFSFDTIKCFNGLEGIKIDGVDQDFSDFFTKVKVWDNGNGIDLSCFSDDEDVELVLGCGRRQLLDFLEGPEPEIEEATEDGDFSPFQIR